MSRIGKLPVDLPAGVTVTVGPGNVVSVKGPLGQLSQKVDSDITVTVEGNQLTVTRPTDQPRHRSMHGLYRALIHNMVVGVSERIRDQAGARRRRLQGRGARDSILRDAPSATLTISSYSCLPEIKVDGRNREEEETRSSPSRASTSSSSVRSLPRSARCASRNLTRARVSSSWANSSAARLVSLLMLNSKIVELCH